MRILAISHAAILDVNRPLYVDLAKRGHDVRLIVPSSWRNDFGPDLLRPDAATDRVNGRFLVRPARIVRFGRHIQYYWPAAFDATARWEPDVMLIDEEPWSFATAQWARFARRHGYPFAVWTHENRMRRYIWPLSTNFYGVLSGAAWIFAISDDSGALLRRHGYAGGTSVLPHAIDATLFYPDSLAQRTADAPMQVGYLGRLVPAKGIETLLQALAEPRITPLYGDRIQCHIYGAGEAEYVRGLRALAERLGLSGVQVQWHDAVKHADVPAAIRGLDLVVAPTVAHSGYKEQFGRVVIEALACGVPLITSDNGELPVLMRKSGGGLVVPEGRPEALAGALVTAVTAPEIRAAWASAGHAYVQHTYTYGAVTGDVECVLAAIADKSRGAAPSTVGAA